MKTTKRFENAITKLYKAFHDGTLDSGNCHHCAVGNICNNSANWSEEGSFYIGVYHKKGSERHKKAISEIDKTGYSVQELVRIESIFMRYTSTFTGHHLKEKEFDGLCAVVEYLCQLDGIPNVMDYTSLFETENNKPIKELAF